VVQTVIERVCQSLNHIACRDPQILVVNIQT
jgi:hypothetical protein